MQHKLNAIADGIADLMEHVSDDHDDDGLMRDVEELREAVGSKPGRAPRTTSSTRPRPV